MIRRCTALLGAALLAHSLSTVAAAAEPAAGAPVHHRSAATAALGLPFSDAVQVGDLLLLSGQLGNLPGSLELAPGGIDGQTRQAMENIGQILADAGASFADVVKCTVFLADIADWPAFNVVYREYFKGERLPARSALAASGLAMGAKVEVECIAVLPARG